MKTRILILLILALLIGCNSAEPATSDDDPTPPTTTAPVDDTPAPTATATTEVVEEDGGGSVVSDSSASGETPTDEESDDDTVDVANWSADPDDLPFDTVVWSYHFESISDDVRNTYAVTATADYPNNRFSYVTHGQGNGVGGAVEMVAIDNTMHMAQEGADCFSFSSAEFDTDTILQGADSFINYANATNAERGNPFEVEVNGFDTRHYLLDERVFGVGNLLSDGTFRNGEAHVYVHTLEDGREIIIRSTVEGVAVDVDEVETTVNYRYEIDQADQPVNITLPEGCEELPSADERPYPLYPDAVLSADMGTMQAFTVNATAAEVADFYDAEMSARGWTQESRMDNAGITQIIYTQDGTTLNFNITPNPSGEGVQITVIQG